MTPSQHVADVRDIHGFAAAEELARAYVRAFRPGADFEAAARRVVRLTVAYPTGPLLPCPPLPRV